MKIAHSIAAASICMLLGSPTWAADQNEHNAHHPDTASSSSKMMKGDLKSTSKSESNMHNTMLQESIEKMNSQMKLMNDMHEKMMNTKTPEERKALMADHLKAMHGGMEMMSDMSKSSGMSMMGNMSNEKSMKMDMKGKAHDEMKCDMGSDMATHHQLMEKRMQMMETMMQMMMDRMTP